MPIAEVGNRSGFAGGIAQILRSDTEGVDQLRAISDVITTAIEIGEEPFMGVEDVAVSEFNSLVNVAEFGADRRRARHGRVHVQPDVVLAADASDLFDGIDGKRRSGAYSRAGKEREVPVFYVPLYRLFEQIGA